MKKPPEGWPQISSAVFYDDAAAAIPWLRDAFGFEVKLKIEGEDGRIRHSELVYGEGMIMVGNTGNEASRPNPLPAASPRSLGGKNTQALCIFVDDVDAHCEHARKAGAKIIDEPVTHDHGEDYWMDRTYRAEDLEGHQWWFMQRLRGAKPKA
jgi:uncharacterized glyoxalase superfamily protein PhnB